MKKALALVCCLLAMVYLLYHTGFFSYIRDGGSLVEPMRVEVKLNEHRRSPSGELMPSQGAMILKPDANAYEGSPYLQQYDSWQWQGVQSGVVEFWSSGLERAVDKIVTVTNNGNTPVYVRVVFAFEHLSSTLWKNVYTAQGANQIIHHGAVTIHGQPFDLYSYTYAQSLAPGETSCPSLVQIALDANANAFDLMVIAGGYEIISVAQACQATGLPSELPGDAFTVLNTLVGEISTEQHPWVGQ